ncbi:MAG: endopeptidase La [Blastocatellia bacterium]|nr:endopeptidase La [Blastocatellia bacterium]
MTENITVADRTTENTTLELPILPLRNTVIFPSGISPLTVGRPMSLAAAEAALQAEEKLLGVVAQREDEDSEPSADNLYRVGTLVVINRMMRSPGTENVLHLIVQGQERFRIVGFTEQTPHLKARVEILPEPAREETPEVEALRRNINALVQKALTLLPNVPSEIRNIIVSAEDSVRLAYFLASVLELETTQEQALLEADTESDLLRMMHSYLAREVEVLEIRSQIANQAQEELGKTQRDYILREQMRQIQKELGENEPEQAEAAMMRERVEKADLPDDVRKEAERELRRLERLPSAAPDYHVIRTYLEMILELPWKVSTEDNLDLNHAREVLDEDHYDLDDIKERILEHLAVIKLNPNTKAPILCFVGPPGVGKTSLGQSIARAMGRKFERMSLGGVRDEAELRGHRRTYIGALPGRIIQALRRAGVNNPVMMLDEVDKLGMDFRGDPASALLEILDPAQNFSFRDHYLDLPFDLSRVFFIATANSLGPIPPALRDRMEIIGLAGYSEDEKLHIAKRYLAPRQIKETGLGEEQLQITDEAIQAIASRYTREAGVRQLERTIGKLARKVALKVAQGKGDVFTITPDDLEEYLGHEKFFHEMARDILPPGVATGLAVTDMGGEVLFVEATLLPGGKGLTLTGQLGEVMQESAKAAHSYLWSHAKEMGFNCDCIETFEKSGVHLHVPAGAIPKDGPSAGVAIVSALASLCTGRAVRNDTAMTGEITLSGLVFPVGGIKGKVLAAHRAGIKRVVLPRRNEHDLKDLPQETLKDLEVVFVERVDDLLKATLTPANGEPCSEPEGEGEPVTTGSEVSFEGGDARV